MLDIKLIREDSKMVRENLEKRQNPELIKRLDYVIKFDKAWRDVLQELNSSRKRKNNAGL